MAYYADTDIREKIRRKFNNSMGFLPYIDEIRFPMYKALEEDLKISLDWPITALVGPNGTNKSSILQAISAAPEGRSLAQFWFSTEVDNIDAGTPNGDLHRFIYKYTFDRSGIQAECRKYRGNKPYRSSEVPAPLRGKRDPDYWEPTKWVKKDKMTRIPMEGYAEHLTANRDRWKQIKKKVVYLDFRAELSSFDKFIHHQSFNHRVPDATSKRHSAVIKSKYIAQALNGQNVAKRERDKLISGVRYFSQQDVRSVANILGKPIEKISIIEHRFFGPTGYTIKLFLSQSDTSYSEAHAGSGEYAVVRLVDQIRRADERSLILLDEPEVSLHPGAQVKLLEFLEEEVLRKGLQIVFSTHSPFLVERLPNEAIKVLGFNTSKERVVLVSDGCSHTEAFAHLGHTTSSSDKPRIIVEDDLVVEIVKASLRRQAPTKLDAMEIVAFPGGANGIIKNLLPSMAISGLDKAGILLDGDQKPQTVDTERDVLVEAQQACSTGATTELQRIWREQFHETSLNLFSDTDRKNDANNLYKCIAWAQKHLDFLPGKQPEQALALAQHPDLEDHTDWKAYWRQRTGDEKALTDKEREYISASEILECQKRALNELNFDNELFNATKNKVEAIIEW